MKRFAIISMIMALAMSVPMSLRSAENKPLFGVKVALDVNIPGKWHNSAGSIDMYRHGYGANIGGVCNVWLGKGFFFEPGVSLYYDSYSFKDLIVDGGPDSDSDKDPRLYKIGVRIPLVVGYDWQAGDRFFLSFFTGPELNYSFAGKYIFHNKEVWGDMSDNPFLDQRRLDCAWKIGVGVPLNGFMISAEAAIGITDLMKSPDLSFRENRFTIALTRYF